MPPPKKRALKAVKSGATAEEAVAPLPPGSAVPVWVEKRTQYAEWKWTKARREGRIEIQTWHERRQTGPNEWDYTGRTEKRERAVPPDARRCTAIHWSGVWIDERCVRPCQHGARVCTQHGGKLPNIKKNAQARLAMAALPAAEKLIHIALVKRGVLDKDRLKAIEMILNRAGIEGRATVEVEVKPWQDMLKAVQAQLPGAASSGDALELIEGEDFEVAVSEEDDDNMEDDDD